MSSSVQTIIKPSLRDVGGIAVRRVLPALAARLVGPFIFFDHMGPASLAAGAGLDVRPHPHIGLATVTYLFEGAIMHRDSIGSVQKIEPGDVNWMTAGRGIVHSERTPEEERGRDARVLHGIQTWIALPLENEDAEPSFEHHCATTLPRLERDGVQLDIVAGTAFNARSPVATFSPTLYVAARFAAGGILALEPEHEERGVYVVDGSVNVDDVPLAIGQMAVLAEGRTAMLSSPTGARVMLLGGAKLAGGRFIDWNFVASSRERIEQAKRAWTDQAMGKVPGETEWIPLPERGSRQH
ncbi:MAG TPA: pirin family protein [Trinickia sp.]|jgi:redox-sensitive bicupin YhaK (pirin superfamily)|uniref:pirin family protein n=1 Tax=Trinickia sp. TaxID=2571163 RepID=UPI002B9A20D4|nr:pirin family protein [Trinickia sp.]HTI17766.1 pirin family protein [Trinickia sp.]